MKVSRAIFLILVLGKCAWAAPYNEMYDARGKLRPAYRQFQSSHRKAKQILNPSPETMKVFSDKPFGDKIKILPIPIVLSPEDLYSLEEKTATRGALLRAIFEDLVLGKRKAIKAGIVDAAFVDRTLAEIGYKNLKYLRQIWAGKSSKYLQFIYGPDIVRTADGTWVALEDGTGNHMGGLGDLMSTHHFFETHYADAIGRQFRWADIVRQRFEETLKKFLKRHAPSVHNVTQDWDPYRVFLVDDHAFVKTHPDHEVTKKYLTEEIETKDFESVRLLNFILAKMQTPGGHSSLISEIASRGEDKETPEEQEARLIRNQNAWEFFSKNIWAILNFSSRQLTEKLTTHLFRKHGVALLDPPGVHFLENKAWMAYLPELAKFYGIEADEMVPSPQTTVVSGASDLSLIEQAFLKNQDVVVKKGNSAQGKDVSIVSKMNPEQKAEALKNIKDEFEEARLSSNPTPLYIIQERVVPSVVEVDKVVYNLDFRPLHWVDVDSEYGQSSSLVVPWARAARADENFGKTNVSLSAVEAVVLADKVKYAVYSCKQALSKRGLGEK